MFFDNTVCVFTACRIGDMCDDDNAYNDNHYNAIQSSVESQLGLSPEKKKRKRKKQQNGLC